MGRPLAFASLLIVAISWCVPDAASAQGLEFAGPGTRSLGRGGAFMARADDPMALGYNPAALAFLPGYQLMAGTHLTFYDSCVQRSGTYDDSAVSERWAFESRFGPPDTSDPDNWVNQPFPQVCRDGYPGPSPQIVFTMHPLEWLGLAVGILAPAGVGNGRWGSEEGTVEVDGRQLPVPTRYAIRDQDLLLFHPSIGVGISPIPELSFGLTLQWGIANVEFVNHTSASSGPEDPADDVRTELNVSDPFVPAMIASVHVVPIDELDIVATARISDSIDGDGSLALTTGTYGTGARGSLRPRTTTIEDTHLHAGLPWQFGLGVRYAERVRPRYRDPDQAGRVTGRVEDAMQNEVWDLELDLVYSMNSHVTDFVVTPPEGAAATVCEADGTDDPNGCTVEFDATLPGKLPIPHGWNDQLSVRVGADWNVLPGQLALRAGTHFVTSGINSSFQMQDVLPGMRLGLHLGATLRIDRFDISLAYAHIFQFDETITVPAGEEGYRLVAATGEQGVCMEDGMRQPDYDEDRPVVQRGCYPEGFGAIVNRGTYTAEYNVVSVDVRYHF